MFMSLKTLPFIYSYCIEHNPFFYEKMKEENELEKRRGGGEEGQQDTKRLVNKSQKYRRDDTH